MPTDLRTMVHRLMPWRHDCLILVGGTLRQASREAARLLGQPDVEEVTVSDNLGRAWFPDGKPTALWVRSLDPVDLPVLLHEVIHVVSRTLRNRGLVLSCDSEEAFTYTAEEMFRAIMTERHWQRVRRKKADAD